jgi:peptidoglycan hydrolase-like protein with peptidoglycan-binding domain
MGKIVPEGLLHERFCTVFLAQVSESISGGINRGQRMFLAGKVASSGIVFLLLATGISGPRPTPLPLETSLNKEVSTVEHGNDVWKMQQTLGDKGQYRGEVDGVIGLRTRASIRAYQKAENLPVTGQLDARTASKLGVTPELRDKTRSATSYGKPSAGIQWVQGSRRTSKAPRKAVKTVAAAERSRTSREQTLQAENEKHDR